MILKKGEQQKNTYLIYNFAASNGQHTTPREHLVALRPWYAFAGAVSVWNACRLQPALLLNNDLFVRR